MKPIPNTFFLIILTIIPLLIFYLSLKKEFRELKQQNVIISKSYYPLKGLSYKKIVEEVKNKNIKSHKNDLISGGSVKAVFYLKPLKVPKPKNNICQLSKRDFHWSIRINYVLPKWKSSHIASTKLKNRWDRYLKRLVKHEDKHRDIFLEGASAIRLYIENIPQYILKKTDENCLNYLSQVKQKIFLIFKGYEGKNLAFDLSTGFGSKNNVIF